MIVYPHSHVLAAVALYQAQNAYDIDPHVVLAIANHNCNAMVLMREEAVTNVQLDDLEAFLRENFQKFVDLCYHPFEFGSAHASWAETVATLTRAADFLYAAQQLEAYRKM
jgi:hypothetical protein